MSTEGMNPIDGSCTQDAAPYVLGALIESEHAAFVTHMQSCVVCREEVAALGGVVAVLPSAVPQVSAPTELKRRVMATVTSEAALREERAPLAAARSPRSGFPRLSSWPVLGSLAGAAAVAVIAVIAVIALSSGGGTSTKVIRAQVTVPKASVSVRVSGGHAELNVVDMPQTAPNHVYEVWVKRTGDPQPTDALFTVSTAGRATVGVPGDIKGIKEILVTSEPTGGSEVPSSNPVILAKLS
jgi:anti-sigma-K factor RskA